MANLKLGEQLVELVVAKLKAGMAARITTINADATLQAYARGDFQLDTPKASSYYTSGLSTIPEAPAIIVAEAPAEFGEEGPHSFLTRTQIAVWILEQDPDRQRLGKKLQRQSRAVMETLWDDDPKEALVSGGWAFRIFPTRTQPGRVFEPTEEDSWRALYLVLFVVQAQEG